MELVESEANMNDLISDLQLNEGAVNNEENDED